MREVFMFDETCGDAAIPQVLGTEDHETAYDDNIIENPGRELEGDVLYTTGNIEDIFHCISMVCTRNAVDSP